MVETPAAAISGSEIVPALRAKVAGYDDDVHPVYGFASFGINDLTQTTLAISRDDVPIALRRQGFLRASSVHLDSPGPTYHRQDGPHLRG